MTPGIVVPQELVDQYSRIFEPIKEAENRHDLEYLRDKIYSTLIAMMSCQDLKIGRAHV